MTTLVFHEKPGCVGNQHQHAWLRQRGVEVEVRDLFGEAWTAKELRRYFGDMPVSDWFNGSAPAVRSGEVDIDACSAAQALEMMLRQPLLIKRPLMAVGEVRQAGFTPGPVLEALGLVPQPDLDMQACPMDASPATGGGSA